MAGIVERCRGFFALVTRGIGPLGLLPPAIYFLKYTKYRIKYLDKYAK